MNYEIQHRGHLHADEPSSGPGGRSAFQGTERRVGMNGGCLGWIKADLSACHNVRLLWRGTCLVRVAWSHSVAELGATHTYPYGGSGCTVAMQMSLSLTVHPWGTLKCTLVLVLYLGKNSLPLMSPLLGVRPGLHRGPPRDPDLIGSWLCKRHKSHDLFEYSSDIFAPAGAERDLNQNLMPLSSL